MRGGVAKAISEVANSLVDKFLQHARIAASPLVVHPRRSESSVPGRFVEHGFESATIADILKYNQTGNTADDLSWLFCTTNDSVYNAAEAMTHNNVGALVVVNPGVQDSIQGIVTSRDYLSKVILQGRPPASTKVGDIMTEQNKLITVTPDTKVLKAMELMSVNRIRHIPVVEGKKMKGMVSIADVVRALVDEHREELKRLSDYIHGGY